LRLSKTTSKPAGSWRSGGFSAVRAGGALGFSGGEETGLAAFGAGMSLPKKALVNSLTSPLSLEGGGGATGGSAAFKTSPSESPPKSPASLAGLAKVPGSTAGSGCVVGVLAGFSSDADNV